MPHIIWSPRATRDLERLWRFLVLKDPEAARRAIATLRQGVAILERHRLIGRPIDSPPAGQREWSIRFGSSGYVARYRYDGESVTILALWHMRELRY